MRRDARNANCLCILLEHLPDDLLAQAFARHSISTVHGTEHITIRDADRGSPGIDRHFGPGRHRRRAHAAMLSPQIDDAPATITLLDVCERERGYLRSSETATEKDS